LLFALAWRAAFGLDPALLDQWYMQGLFPYIRQLQTWLASLHPVPGYYLLTAVALLWLWRTLPGLRKINGSARQWVSWKQWGRRWVNFAGVVASLFLMLWGFLYADLGLGARMGLAPAENRSALADAYQYAMAEAIQARSTIPGLDTLPHIEALPYRPQPAEMEAWVRQFLTPLGYPTRGKVVVRYVRPKGTLRRLGIAGIYNPFFGDAHVESAHGPLQSTFTTAHEMAHAFGVTGEGEANFTAWMACAYYGDPVARYAAWYTLWRYLASEVNKRYDADVIAALAERIPEPLRADREAIWRTQHKYAAYFPEISNALNDTYLRVQGIEAGTDDYDTFVYLWFDHMAATGREISK
jgi:hypothetical protein